MSHSSPPPSGASYGAPPGWNMPAPTPLYAPAPQQAPNGVLALVLTLIGWFVGFLPIAWIGFFVARAALSQYPGCTVSKVAYWFGLASLIVGALLVVVIMGAIVIAMQSGAGIPVSGST